LKKTQQTNQNHFLKRVLFLAPLIAYSCAPAQSSKIKADASAESPLYVKIGELESDNTYTLLIAASQESATLRYCAGSEKCVEGSKAEFLANSPNKKVYRTSQITLENNQSLRFETTLNDSSLQFVVLKFIKRETNNNPDPDSPDIIKPQDYDWEKHINFVDVAPSKFSGNTYTSEHYKDVMSHVQRPYLQDSALTIVHESHHFLLHEQDGKTAARDKFVYHKQGKGAYYLEPNLKTLAVDQSLPSAIVSKGKLYKTYIKSRPNQEIGENMVDEWQAYIAENISLIEATKNGTNITNDSVEGASTEFLYYNATAMMRLAKDEPAHLEKENTKAIFAMLAEKTRWIHDNMKDMNQLSTSHSQEIFDHLQSNEESKEIREALKKIYGAGWTKRVLGF